MSLHVATKIAIKSKSKGKKNNVTKNYIPMNYGKKRQNDNRKSMQMNQVYNTKVVQSKTGDISNKHASKVEKCEKSSRKQMTKSVR